MRHRNYSGLPRRRLPSRNGKKRKVSNPIYYTRTWKIVRQLTLERDGYTCRIGLPGCKVRARCADHIIAMADGGAPFDLNNLQAACGSCNVAKENRARQLREARGQVRAW